MALRQKYQPLSVMESYQKMWQNVYEGGLSQMAKFMFESLGAKVGSMVQKPEFVCRWHTNTEREMLSDDDFGYFVPLKYSSAEDGEIQLYTFGCAFKGVITSFNMYWANIINMVYYLKKEGGFDMGDIMKCDFFFAKMLYDKLAEDIEERNKQQEQQAEEQAKMYEEQRQMMSSYNMNSMMNNSGFQMPTLPSFK